MSDLVLLTHPGIPGSLTKPMPADLPVIAQLKAKGWEETTDPADVDAPVDLTDVDLAQPPRSGAGSGRDAWATYAAAVGVTVTDDLNRDDIVDAVDEYLAAAGGENNHEQEA